MMIEGVAKPDKLKEAGGLLGDIVSAFADGVDVSKLPDDLIKTVREESLDFLAGQSKTILAGALVALVPGPAAIFKAAEGLGTLCVKAKDMIGKILDGVLGVVQNPTGATDKIAGIITSAFTGGIAGLLEALGAWLSPTFVPKLRGLSRSLTDKLIGTITDKAVKPIAEKLTPILAKAGIQPKDAVVPPTESDGVTLWATEAGAEARLEGDAVEFHFMASPKEAVEKLLRTCPPGEKDFNTVKKAREEWVKIVTSAAEGTKFAQSSTSAKLKGTDATKIKDWLRNNKTKANAFVALLLEVRNIRMELRKPLPGHFLRYIDLDDQTTRRVQRDSRSVGGPYTGSRNEGRKKKIYDAQTGGLQSDSPREEPADIRVGDIAPLVPSESSVNPDGSANAPPRNAAVVDHIIPRNDGRGPGTNCYSNARIISHALNQQKYNK